MKNILLYLKDLNFTEIESTIYLNLLKNGPSTILEISRRTGLNRITAHTNCANLLRKGLLSTIKRGGRRFIIAEPPEKIYSLVQSEEVSLERKKETLPRVIELLKAEASHVGARTYLDVRTYEGKKAISLLYDEILQSKELRAFVNAEEINKLYPQNFQKFRDAAANNSIEIWDVVENNSFGKVQQALHPNPKYHLKMLPKGVEIGSMDYLNHDDRITIIEGEPQPVAVVISSPSLYLNSKAIFDVMWSLL